MKLSIFVMYQTFFVAFVLSLALRDYCTATGQVPIRCTFDMMKTAIGMQVCMYVCMCKKEPQKPLEHTSEHVKSWDCAPRPPLHNL